MIVMNLRPIGGEDQGLSEGGSRFFFLAGQMQGLSQIGPTAAAGGIQADGMAEGGNGGIELADPLLKKAEVGKAGQEIRVMGTDKGLDLESFLDLAQFFQGNPIIGQGWGPERMNLKGALIGAEGFGRSTL